MAASRQIAVANDGFTILNDPEQPQVDIIILHGLGGSASTTFSCKAARAQASFDDHRLRNDRGRRRRRSHDRRSSFWRALTCSGESDTEDENKGSAASIPVAEPTNDPESDLVHWPRDLLPQDCPSARIMTWGYAAKVAKGGSAASQTSLFGFARDLLYALWRQRPQRLPILFVAHSLGGLVVKEALRRSEIAEEPGIQDILKSTIGVIFLGTPHRGSADLASLAEVVRKVANCCLVSSNPVLLRTLGVDSPELELGRESFMKQWRLQNFQVKTFQEAQPMTAVNLGLLGEKVVPDISSSLDDPREHAETILANHMNMCKFNGKTDPGYRKILGEIQIMVANLTERARKILSSNDAQDFLRSLHYPEMYQREATVRRATANTCNWLFSQAEYDDWHNRQHISKHHGLLWIKGKPGSGKSTLMKEAGLRISDQTASTRATTASFFFNARGTSVLEKSPLGLYRSLLHQVLQQDALALKSCLPRYVRKRQFQGSVSWSEDELQDMLRQTYATREAIPAFVLVDAMDECDDREVQVLVQFFRELTTQAWKRGASLNICLSSRHYPHISVENCPELVVEHHNRADILQYISTEAESFQIISRVKDKIFAKSSNVFLWVVLVVAMLKKEAHGKSVKWIERKLEELPAELTTLFRALFDQLSNEDSQKATCLIQLVLFSHRRLTLSELHCALGFSVKAWASFKAFQESEDFLSEVDERRQMVIQLSRGLLEAVRPEAVDASEQSESLASDPHQTYQFIHESVRDFFLKENGFTLLDRSFSGNIIGRGHSQISQICTNYLCCHEVRVSSLTHPELSSRMDQSDYVLALPKIYSSRPEFEFLTYAALYLFAHLEAAEQGGMSQEPILRLLTQDGESLFQRFHIWLPLNLNYEPEIRTELPLLAFDQPSYEEGESLLYYCCRKVLIGLVRRALLMGANPNARAYTALVYPLLAAAAPSQIYDYWHADNARRFDSAQQDVCDLFRLLCANGADINARGHFGLTALHLASFRLTRLANETLLELGANINAVDDDGETALHRAVLGLNQSTLDLLLERGANHTFRDNHSRNPLDLAVDHQFGWVIRRLMLAGVVCGNPVFANSLNSWTETGDWGRE